MSRGRWRDRGSNHQERQRKVVARLQQHVAESRKDRHGQVAAWLVAKRKAIVVEDLNIQGLARGGLSRQVTEVGWGQCIKGRKHKAEKAGIPVIKIDPGSTTKRCSVCGAIVPKALSVRVHDGPHCGLVLDRDYNAAPNIWDRAGIRPAVARLDNSSGWPQVLVWSSI